MELTPDDAKKIRITPPEIPNCVKPARNVLKKTTGTIGEIDGDTFKKPGSDKIAQEIGDGLNLGEKAKRFISSILAGRVVRGESSMDVATRAAGLIANSTSKSKKTDNDNEGGSLDKFA